MSETNSATCTIYTDGACSNNQSTNRRAGAGAVLLIETKVAKTAQRLLGNVTNQVAELEAAILGLETARAGGHASIILCSDSQYLIKTMKGEFRRKTNLEVWERVDQAAEGMYVSWNWVRGHSGNKFQEMADRLAVSAVNS